jgi:hypothetical protein
MLQTDYIHVPYGKAVYGEAEIEAVMKVLRTSTQMGKHVREMEERVAGLYNKKYGVPRSGIDEPAAGRRSDHPGTYFFYNGCAPGT